MGSVSISVVDLGKPNTWTAAHTLYDEEKKIVFFPKDFTQL